MCLALLRPALVSPEVLGPVILSLALISLAAGGASGARVAWMEIKRQVSQILIAHAFEAHVREGVGHLPWRHADLAPIAELRAERLGITRHVLSGGSGTSMAFGVGHMDGSSPPNQPGNCVLVGHRDAALDFLGRLRRGDRLRLQTAEACRIYEITGHQVVHERDLGVLRPTTGRRVTLVTCYPLEEYGPTPWRLVVVGEAAEGPQGAVREQQSLKGVLTVCSYRRTTSRGVGPSIRFPGVGGSMSTHSDTSAPTNPYRTVSYDAAAAHLRPRASEKGTATATTLSNASLGFVNHVPESLKHIGCMWLENGDERCRCGAEPTWTMGSTFDAPRLYCEYHAQQILMRRMRERNMQRQRRIRMQAQMSLS